MIGSKRQLISIYGEVVADGSLVDERDVAVGDLSLALAALAAGDVAQLLSVLLQGCWGREKQTKIMKRTWEIKQISCGKQFSNHETQN